MDGRESPQAVMGLSFPTEAEHVVVSLGRCRGHAIAAAATAVSMSTPASEDAPSEIEHFRLSAKAFLSDLRRALTPEILEDFQSARGEDIVLIRHFGKTIDEFAQPQHALDFAASKALLREARDQVLPALVRLTDCILAKAAADQNAVLDRIQRRNDELEAMFGKMERVGRTINMISINASIEAARAGGASGRAFGIIASEVRDLSTQARSLLERARQNIG
jgi:methyl-accepting chemotaxis protein